MTLQEIEELILVNVGHKRYSELSVSSIAEDIEDFRFLHGCVNLAREEVKINSAFPQLMTFGTAITVAAGNFQYSLPVDFDIAVAMYFATNLLTVGNKLTQIDVRNLPANISNSDTGTPSSYVLSGIVANLAQIYLLPIPETAGVLLPLYKPVLTKLSTSTDEDIIMKKYPGVVINFASAFAFQYIKKDGANHDKYYLLGISDCKKINLREASFDPDPTVNVESLLAVKRNQRTTR